MGWLTWSPLSTEKLTSLGTTSVETQSFITQSSGVPLLSDFHSWILKTSSETIIPLFSECLQSKSSDIIKMLFTLICHIPKLHSLQGRHVLSFRKTTTRLVRFSLFHFLFSFYIYTISVKGWGVSPIWISYSISALRSPLLRILSLWVYLNYFVFCSSYRGHSGPFCVKYIPYLFSVTIPCPRDLKNVVRYLLINRGIK